MNTDKAFQDFLAAFDEKTRQKSTRETREEQVARKKRDMLEPIALLLERLSRLGLVVEDARSAARQPGFAQGVEARFTVEEGPSAPSWAPGVSLFIDHPAAIEIAIPNESDAFEKGPVVITCATQHPDRGMLVKKHLSVHAAAEALARFLAKNTLRIQNDPRSGESRAVGASEPVGEPEAPLEPPASDPAVSAFSTLATPREASPQSSTAAAPIFAPLQKSEAQAQAAPRPATTNAGSASQAESEGGGAKTVAAATARVAQSPNGARLAGGPKPPAGAMPARARPDAAAAPSKAVNAAPDAVGDE